MKPYDATLQMRGAKWLNYFTQAFNSNYIHIYYQVLACMAFDWKPDCTRHLNE